MVCTCAHDELKSNGTTEEYFRRMLRKAVQQGRSERRGEGEAYASVRGASERCENAAGGLFQHPLEECFTQGRV